jgi:hypothetical protein
LNRWIHRSDLGSKVKNEKKSDDTLPEVEAVGVVEARGGQQAGLGGFGPNGGAKNFREPRKNFNRKFTCDII